MNYPKKFQINPLGLVIGIGVGTALGVSNGGATGLGVGSALAIAFSLRASGGDCGKTDL